MMRYVNGLLMVFCLMALCAVGQDSKSAARKRELEQRKKALQQEIDQYSRELERTRKDKRLSLQQIEQLNSKISKREALINTINDELVLTNQQIEHHVESINDLTLQIRQMRRQYGQLIYRTHLAQGHSGGLALWLGSKDATTALRRMAWVRQIGEDRRKQAALIEQKTGELNQEVKDLELRKIDQGQLLMSKEKEKQVLAKEKTEQESSLHQLQAKEKDIRKKIRKKQEEASKLNSAILKIIEEEVQKARDEAVAAAKKRKAKQKAERLQREKQGQQKGKNDGGKPAEEPQAEPEPERMSTTQLLNLNPESQKLSNHFEANKSRLPWPVSQGRITETFGEHEHPVLKGIKIKNNGVDIATQKGAESASVFEGEVTGVVSIPGSGKAVIVRHGEFLTVYSNLSDVSVQKGDKVRTRQSIGRVGESDEGTPELHFEVWKGNQLLNPQQWLIRR
jgi:septal ring factor EnvC (AmiA/AmiB activator)